MTTPDVQITLTIARRARKNLELVDYLKNKYKEADFEEFTQLLSSMFTMLICLREEYFRDTPVTWAQVETAGLKPIKIMGKKKTLFQPNLKQSNSFNQLIRNLRNALAHNNFKLISNSKKEIVGVEVWNLPNNTPNKTENRTWEAKITQKQLKNIAYLFIDYLDKIHGNEVT